MKGLWSGEVEHIPSQMVQNSTVMTCTHVLRWAEMDQGFVRVLWCFPYVALTWNHVANEWHPSRLSSSCNDYLAYGTIFTRVTFRPKIRLDLFFCQKSCRWMLGGGVPTNTPKELLWSYIKKVSTGMVDEKVTVISSFSTVPFFCYWSWEGISCTW